ncbi:MAG: dynamin family protein [Methylobacillus sp.]|nr:dynamin family protein [Methylobacillus sp.]
MSNLTFEQQISEYHQWRERLNSAIHAYRDWLEQTDTSDAMQDLRLYDLSQIVMKDRLLLAFVAEFARGKTETINALLSSNFRARLLPVEPGRTTMCPSEIFWDEAEKPYIKLLPIETRKRDDSLNTLRNKPLEWVNLRLDISSLDTMREALRVLVATKEVTLGEARALGLWSDEDPETNMLKDNGMVEVPVWRHALINYPHPLLKTGLVILDTPGMNTLGAEPELTISTIPNAHAVIFLLAMDTGITKSDMDIWTRYIRDSETHKLAALNKIDILWDTLRGETEVNAMIQSQIVSTARQLGIPPADVFAISAQKALVARVKNDDELLKRSGILRVEEMLARNIIGMKQETLRKNVIAEVSELGKGSRKTIRYRITSLRGQVAELEALRGQNSEVVESMLAKVMANRRLYEESIGTFNEGYRHIMTQGETILEQLSLTAFDEMVSRSLKKIGGSWTTHGLNQGMRSLIKEAGAMAEKISLEAQGLSDMGESLYLLFHNRHGFDRLRPRTLSMSEFHQTLQSLQDRTDEFCARLVNIMTEKHFLVRKFYYTLVSEARKEFEQAEHMARSWIGNLLTPLRIQINEHKTLLDRRSDSLARVNENQFTLQKNLEEVAAQLATAQNQCTTLDRILLTLMTVPKKTDPEKQTTSMVA